MELLPDRRSPKVHHKSHVPNQSQSQRKAKRSAIEAVTKAKLVTVLFASLSIEKLCVTSFFAMNHR
jgi:hypothetical protein